MAQLLYSAEEAEVAAHRRLKAAPCNPAMLKLAAARSVLLLQGPVGPFFDRLASWLKHYGKTVHRVAFQPGDVADSPDGRPISVTQDPSLAGRLRWPVSSAAWTSTPSGACSAGTPGTMPPRAPCAPSSAFR